MLMLVPTPAAAHVWPGILVVRIPTTNPDFPRHGSGAGHERNPVELLSGGQQNRFPLTHTFRVAVIFGNTEHRSRASWIRRLFFVIVIPGTGGRRRWEGLGILLRLGLSDGVLVWTSRRPTRFLVGKGWRLVGNFVTVVILWLGLGRGSFSVV